MHGWAQAPDRVGVVLAARAWKVSRGPSGPRLCSLTRPVEWPVRERLEASCIEPDHYWYSHTLGYRIPHGHDVPDARCSCGIWGLADGGAVVAQQRSPTCVYGVVALWGPLLVGPYGWRARFGYPQALLLRAPRPVASWSSLRARSYGPRPLEELAEVYGVPLLDDWPELSSVEVEAS